MYVSLDPSKRKGREYTGGNTRTIHNNGNSQSRRLFSLVMSVRIRYDDNDIEEDQGLFTNRSTMMANFEEWIKMATDNKINSSNSWNFALIDYFHDLQVLRDAENNINFQKASATLDGCVKIYSSRVDSVTTETGKLLSGLAQSKEKKNKEKSSHEDEGEHGEADESQDGVHIDPLTGLPVSREVEVQSRRRNLNRVLETTLVDFEQIKLKELDQELNIDPIFKKALVDFDEGGAKSFLLNTLSVDSSCRVVFDTAIRDVTKEREEEQPIGSSEMEDQSVNDTTMVEDEILSLGMDFINFEQINNCEVSASIPQLRGVLEDIDKAKNFIEDVNNKFDNFLSEKEIQETVPDADFDDGPELDDGPEFDDVPDPFDEDLGQKDENWHKDVPEPGAPESLSTDADTGIGKVSEQDLMAYFDETLKRNWRGREHWKVRSFKRNLGGESKQQKTQTSTGTEQTDAETPPASCSAGQNNEDAPSTKKKTFEIDFFQLDDDLDKTVFSTHKRKNNIEMPQRLRTSDNHHLLPDDYHFSSDKITRLFIKPGQKMSLFKRKDPRAAEPTREEEEHPTLADEKFWAENYERNEQETTHESEVVQGEIENPFEDYDDNGVDFNQAFEEPEAPLPTPALLSTQDNKVNYARVSKKVDVRKLKDNLWRAVTSLQKESKLLNFTDIAREVGGNYSEEAQRELSTSFCFICLLHLANEHGLQIESSPSYEDLIIT
ncbi:ZYRO0F12980p [Zygosaccharomyces rouxii]|uniref:Condensin complex subunit 2 n=1 Tax=Zygosaccharomyces rouxii (strain ATCC 2623 / CBS 732 / NBRC 1130 / NCYC 568 / NRRL Y-229) TaxID=559307 RepID=C5DYH1_ZYGRC|nr:uncharacterized protein ZYRO0F12980g [Zygosaccharomyces rouxii]KAH9199589.1 condensin complex subunit 2/barren [Zygosaccharomyces rouxii]CAR28832.1 ZYRO0F12980p [Zygosaccharomyces rouxii]